MTRPALIVLFGLMLVAPAAGLARDDREPPPARPFVAGELLVGFKDGVSAAEQRRMLGRFSGSSGAGSAGSTPCWPGCL